MNKVILFLLAVLSRSAFAGEIKVAAASDLKFALDEIIQQYQKDHPQEKVIAVYGASGKFVTQIKEGAPFDLFFSADTEKTEDLVKAEKNSGASFPYAKGHLALWVRNESKLQLDPGMKILLAENTKKIAVANALHAPYGKIAEMALKKAELLEKVKGKLVVGENISQTAQFAESGAADVGLIAKSLALSPALKKEGRFVEVDSSLYTPLDQSGVLLKGPNVALAQKFKDYFLSAPGKKVLSGYGLSL